MKKKIAIYNPYLETKGGGEKVTLSMAEHYSKDHDVEIISKSNSDLKGLGDYFNLDLSRCKHYDLDSKDSVVLKIAHKLRLPGRISTFLHERNDYKLLKKRGYDVYVNNCYKSSMPPVAKNSIYMCMFPQDFNLRKKSPLKKAYHKLVDTLEQVEFGKKGLDIVRSYNSITVNSIFTQNVTSDVWDIDKKELTIVYPICENMKQKDVKKEKIILNVGRFFANSGENHYKCQDKLIETFAKMKNAHKNGWKLVLVGSVANDTDSLKYLLNLYKKAHGLPVEIIPDAPFSDLKKYFNQSSIYWHATGLGSDPEKHPEKQEHFGITTAEAMSAGSVPVVINTAGQKETVKHEASGMLWKDQKELQKYTEELIANPKKLETLSKGAVKQAKKFDKNAFNAQIDELL